MCKNDCCNGDTQPRQDGSFAERKDGLSFSYYPQAGVVKAKLNGVEWNVMTAIHKLCRNHSKFLNCYSDDALLMSDQFFGKSRANQKMGDTYNQTCGENLARERCMAKYHKNFDSRMRLFLEDVRTLLGAVEHYCDVVGIDYSEVESVEKIRAKRFNNT